MLTRLGRLQKLSQLTQVPWRKAGRAVASGGSGLVKKVTQITLANHVAAQAQAARLCSGRCSVSGLNGMERWACLFFNHLSRNASVMNPLFSRLVTPAAVALSLCIAPLGAAAGEVQFGQVASQTNPASATLGKGMTLGIKVYFDKVNAGGGVQGNKLKLVTLDDDLQAPKMLEQTQQLIANPDIVGLLGFVNSAGLAEIARQELAQKNGIALIAPLQGDKNIVSAGNVFPLRSSYTDEVGALLKEAKNWGKDTLAIVKDRKSVV